MYPDFVGDLGFTQNTLEIIVIVGIIVFILGAIIVLYWKHIVVGVLALSCLVVFANHKSTTKPQSIEPTKEEVVNQVKTSESFAPMENVVTPKVKPVQAETPKVEESKDVRKEFMDKCINLADYTRTQCEEIWDDRVKEERALIERDKE